MRKNPFDPMQVYRNRDYACHMMSDAMFDALNDSRLGHSAVMDAVSGCLDAIESIPAGSMRGTVTRDGQEVLITPTYVQRSGMHLSPKERASREAFVKKKIGRAHV